MKKFIKIGLPSLLVLLVVVALIAPIGPVPGFLIGGTDTEAPQNWPDTRDVHEILLEVPGKLPRVVTIWLIQYESEIYVTGYAKSGWVKMLGDGGPVRMRLGENTYSLTASVETEELLPVLTAYKDKYRPDYPDIVADFPPAEEAGKANKVFKLSRS